MRREGAVTFVAESIVNLALVLDV